MAENSRMSKLSEKDDECIFSWKLFSGWDYMIGNAETAHNRVASIVMSFKEALLEEAEKKREVQSWKVIGSRVLVNTGVLSLLALSAFAVITVVARSNVEGANSSMWRRNEITVVMSLISLFFPILFEMLGYFEKYHPRKQLRLQLARIMVLNLLNLYSLIFALFGKISTMTSDLQNTTTRLPFASEPTFPTSSKLAIPSTQIAYQFTTTITNCDTFCSNQNLVAASLISTAIANVSRTINNGTMGTTEYPNLQTENVLAEYITTLSQNLTTLAENFILTESSNLTTLTDYFTTNLNSVTENLPIVTENLRALAENFAKSIENLITLPDDLAMLTENPAALSKYFSSFAETFKALAENLTMSRKNLTTLTENAAATKYFTIFAENFKTLAENLTTSKENVTLIENSATVSKYFTTFAENFKVLAENLTTSTENLTTFTDNPAKYPTIFAENFKALAENLTNSTKNLTTSTENHAALTKYFTTFAEIFKALADNLTTLTTLTENPAALSDYHFTTFAENLRALAENLTTSTKNLTTLTENPAALTKYFTLFAENFKALAENLTTSTDNQTNLTDNLITLTENSEALTKYFTIFAENFETLAENLTTSTENPTVLTKYLATTFAESFKSLAENLTASTETLTTLTKHPAALTKYFTSFVENFKALAENLTTSTETLTTLTKNPAALTLYFTTFTENFKALADNLTTSTQKLATLTENPAALSNYFTTFAANFRVLAENLTTSKENLTILTDNLTTLTENPAALTKYFTLFAANFKVLAENLTTTTDNLTTLTENSKALTNYFTTFAENFQALAKNLTTSKENVTLIENPAALTKYTTFFAENFKAFAENLTTWAENLPILTENAKVLMKYFTTFTENFKALAGNLTTSTKYLTILTDNSTTLTEHPAALTKYFTLFAANFKDLAENLTTSTENITTSTENHAALTKYLTTTFAENFKSLAENLTTSTETLTTLTENPAALTKYLITFAENFKTFADNLTMLTENLTTSTDNSITASVNTAALTKYLTTFAKNFKALADNLTTSTEDLTNNLTALTKNPAALTKYFTAFAENFKALAENVTTLTENLTVLTENTAALTKYLTTFAEIFRALTNNLKTSTETGTTDTNLIYDDYLSEILENVNALINFDKTTSFYESTNSYESTNFYESTNSYDTTNSYITTSPYNDEYITSDIFSTNNLASTDSINKKLRELITSTQNPTLFNSSASSAFDEITTQNVLYVNCRKRCEKNFQDATNITDAKVSGADYRNRSRLRCWETMFGQELVKLTVMDLVLTVISTLAIDFLRGLFVRYMNNCWCWDLEKRFPQYGDFKVAENILHLVNNQGMVWMGMFFSPGLVVLNVFKLYTMMYLRSWAVLTCNVPHEVIFRASRSNNFYFALLLMMLFLCVLPVGYTIVWLEPSWHCGPFSHYERIFHIFTKTIRSVLPESFHNILDYIASPGIVIPLLMLLILIIYYLISLTNALREANNDLKIQLRRERTEERRKMFQIADRRRRGGSGSFGELNTPFGKWKKLLQGLPSGKSFDETPKQESSDVVLAEKSSTNKGMLSKFFLKALKTRKQSISDDDGGTDTEQHESLPDDAKEAKPQVPKNIATQRSSDEHKRVKIKDAHRRKGTFELKKCSKDDKKDDRKDSINSNWSEIIPVITISKTESAECILEGKIKETETKSQFEFKEIDKKQCQETKIEHKGFKDEGRFKFDKEDINKTKFESNEFATNKAIGANCKEIKAEKLSDDATITSEKLVSKDVGSKLEINVEKLSQSGVPRIRYVLQKQVKEIDDSSSSPVHGDKVVTIKGDKKQTLLDKSSEGKEAQKVFKQSANGNENVKSETNETESSTDYKDGTFSN